MILRFADCEVDLQQHTFRRGGRVLALEPQVFDLLVLMASHPGELLARERIIEDVWNGRIVSDAAVSSRINALRRALGDDGRRQLMVQTVPRRGFRFVPEVIRLDADPSAPSTLSPDHAQSLRMTTSRDGTRIAYAISGRGPPLLRAGHFLTHLELDWHSPIWRPLLDRLGARFTVIRYDQRSTGLSDPSPPSLALDRMVDDLEAVADAAGIERFALLAASQGVPVALAFAVRCPERVSRLVLYGGFAQGRTVRGDAREQRNAEAILTIIRQGWGRAGTGFAMAFSTLYMPDATHEQLSHMTEMQLASVSPENAVALRRAVDAFDVSDLLGQVQAPTLILHAEEDSVHPFSQARVLAAGIPGAELHALKGRNHVPLPQDPSWAEFMAASERFLAPSG